MQPGRSCPLAYRYAPAAIAAAPAIEAQCLYVIGGLYGNEPALETIFALAAAEAQSPRLIFNGDFNWFNVDESSFASINCRVLAHTALRGNVETELAGDDEAAGCGCGYPEFVGDETVERSNQIMMRLRDIARGFPDIRRQLASLPMYLRASVGRTQIAIVHGDCESLAGWGLSQEALADAQQRERVAGWFEQANVSVIASTHSCLPVLADFATARGRRVAINNGAAGMPNFTRSQFGVVTRIGVARSPHETLYGTQLDDLYVDALALNYDQARWQAYFRTHWPAGTPAHLSYESRILRGPDYRLGDAIRLSAAGDSAASPVAPELERAA